VINRDDAGRFAARALFWRLAMNRKLRESAITDRRFADANYYAKCIEADTRRALRMLIDQPTKEKGPTHDQQQR
jgi:hypothetical protein